MENVKPEIIEAFLVGRDSEEFIVAVEGAYDSRDVYLVINDPKQGKYIRKDKITPFLWAKQEGLDRLYNGDRSIIKKKMTEFGIKITALKVQDENGNTPERLANGYKYLVQCSKTYTHLITFFEDGGLDIFNDNKEYYVTLAVEIQYLIQTGKRLFKGFEEYNDLHRFQFDLETTGLKADRGDRIFQIGMRDNRGFEHVLEIKGDTEDELDIREINAIITFFNILDELRPDIIAGYNSEFFDFDFIEKRVEALGYDINMIAKTLNPKIPMKRKNSTVKFGSETENYKKTVIWGTNVLDISHAVRRAQAINSDMKSWSLKYVTKFSKVAKDNRVYVPGDKIHTTWHDTVNNYAFNNINGDWYLISDNKPLKEGYDIVKGDYIVQRYLLDDLWETEQVDEIYNQASFLLGKLLPIPYARTTTMGNAVVWKTIMCTWSFEQGLALPSLLPKTEFTGGLSRLLNVGYAKNLVKLDYAALYPNTQITNNIFPDLDITGVLPGILIYIADTRDKYKNLKNELSAQAKEIRKEMKENILLTEEERILKRAEAIRLEKLASNYDKKQLPLKILANSFFGGYGAPYIFNWGDTDCAEETTCRGRQYLRLMVRFFTEKYKFIPLLLDTDGVNYAYPESINEFTYKSSGKHRFNKKDEIYSGVEAVVAEFNDLYMEGRMGLDIDEYCEATINFSKKNYANKMQGKIKIVGNTFKSKTMPTYIEEFIAEGVKLLLDNKGAEFIEYYYSYIKKIYNYEISVAKIASKAKVKSTVKEYLENIKKPNKAGNDAPRKAHMELIIANNLSVGLGDTIYYVNTGKKKSDGDIKTKKDKKTNTKERILNCKLIPSDEIENNPDLIVDDYNVDKYIDMLNKKVETMIVCFKKDIRGRIIQKLVKDKKTKELYLSERSFFTAEETELVAGQPIDEDDQDDYKLDLMDMEDKEISFWLRMNKVPNDINLDEWENIKIDYLERKEKKRQEDILSLQNLLDDAIRRLELQQLNLITTTHKIPKSITSLVDVNDDVTFFISKDLNANIAPFSDLFKYREEAVLRDLFYKTIGDSYTDKPRYDQWLEYLITRRALSGNTQTFTSRDYEQEKEILNAKLHASD